VSERRYVRTAQCGGGVSAGAQTKRQRGTVGSVNPEELQVRQKRGGARARAHGGA